MSVSSAREGGGEENPPHERFTVLLVVEDDEDHRDAVRETLEEEGYRVATAVHGGAALAYLREHPKPDLILLDLMMPEMDGWTFMGEMRKTPSLSDIPVVVVSQAGNRVLSTAPVSAGYLSKPLDRDQLLETVELCLWRRGRKSEG